MSEIKKYLVLIAALLIFYPVGSLARDSQLAIAINDGKPAHIVAQRIIVNRPVLAITPREIDIGTIVAGDIAAGTFTLKNMGAGIMDWSTKGLEGWDVPSGRTLSSTVEDDADYLRVEVNVLPKEQPSDQLIFKEVLYPVEIKLLAGAETLICHKALAAGVYKEAIKITSPGGLRTIFIAFKIVSSQDFAQIILNPERLDVGSVPQGKTVSKKIKLNNKGKEILKWSVGVQRQKRGEPVISALQKGRYFSFANEEIKGTGMYSPPVHLKESISLSGVWLEKDGYPSSAGNNTSLKFNFQGTGLILYYVTYTDLGNLTIYLDENLILEHNWFADKTEKGELLVAESLANGSHTVTLLNKEGCLDIEGVKITGKEIMRGPLGWINIFPDSGSTTLETEYINVNINTAQLVPGFYGDNLLFRSNGGESVVEVFVEVLPDKITKLIDVYRYSKGLDFLFTANPEAETRRLSQNAYAKDGIAFRLFLPETPGTTSFYRWYNPQKKDHFYHYDLKGGGKQIQGYIFEGSIGNIATSRMTNTKELYRWFNAATGHYFYTTDQKGEKAAKKGYRFDGIAGYVR